MVSLDLANAVPYPSAMVAPVVRVITVPETLRLDSFSPMREGRRRDIPLRDPHVVR